MNICYCPGNAPYEPISDVMHVACDDEAYIITFFNGSTRRIPFKFGAQIQIVDWCNMKEYKAMREKQFAIRRKLNTQYESSSDQQNSI